MSRELRSERRQVEHLRSLRDRPGRFALRAAVLGALVLAGCGGGASSEQKLDIAGEVGHARVAAGTFCLGVSEGGAGGPGGAEAARVLERLVREWPDEKVDGETVRQHAQDMATMLDGCGDDGARYARELDRALGG